MFAASRTQTVFLRPCGFLFYLGVLMFTRRILFSILSTSLIFMSGCKVDTPNITITTAPGTTGSVSSSALSCAASLAPSVTTVVSGQITPILLQASGGTAPYYYPGLSGSFNSQLTISDTFQNVSNQNIQVSRTYMITDSAGNGASCPITVTVVPANPVSNLACAFSVDNASPSVGQTVNFGVTVTGGTSPYTASQYTAGSDTTYASPLAQITTSTYSSVAVYGLSGMKTASVILTDSNGAQVSCSQVVNVQAGPSVTVTASPSTTVAAGSPITLTSSVSGFSSNPSVTFSTASGGVAFTTSGNSVVVSTTDYLSHTVVVNVSATTSTQQANTSITLNFTGSQTSLACSLYHTSGYYQVGDSITFSVSATTGEALSLTSLSAQDGTVIDALGGSSARIQFSSSGYKNIYATARSASSGALCNSGASLTDSIYISAAPVSLSCTATTNPNPSYTGNFFLVRAVIPSGAGVGKVRLTNIQTSWNAQTSYSYYNDATSSYMAIYNAGSFPIVLTVTDDAGNTATCSTTQVVYW
jgi:hypothetical protein